MRSRLKSFFSTALVMLGYVVFLDVFTFALYHSEKEDEICKLIRDREGAYFLFPGSLLVCPFSEVK